jgi:2-keto-4-pentenoate hydratase
METETTEVQEIAIPAERNDRMRQTAEVLLEARRTRRPIAELEPDLRPQTLAEAYAVQDVMAQAFGALEAPGIGGWKIGAPAPDATPLFAPMPLIGGFLESGATLAPSYSRMRGIEAEVAFLLGRDLPRREQPYSEADILDAIASAHPAIEILETAFVDPDAVDPLSKIADMQMHGGFAYGTPVYGWQVLDLGAETVEVFVDGALRYEGKSQNTAGSDLLRLVTWLANEAGARTGGLSAGQWITTGSWSGKESAMAGSPVEVRFAHFGEVAIKFALETE